MSAMSDIIDTVPEEDRSLVGLCANRYLNGVPGRRPSDAARSIVADYNANPVLFVERETELRRREHAGR